MEKLIFKLNLCIVLKIISDYNLIKGSKSFLICFLLNVILSFYKYCVFLGFSVNLICIRIVFIMVGIIICILVLFDVYFCVLCYYVYYMILCLV